jgi:hypothetical protein
MGHGDLDWNLFRASLKSAEEFRTGKKKAQATLDAAGLSDAWPIYLAGFPSKPGLEYPKSSTSADDWTMEAQKAADEAAHGFYQEKAAFERERKEEIAIFDIVTKLIKYGSVSENTLKYVGTCLARIPKRAEILAARAAEKEAAAPCPAGRVVVIGKVLKVNDYESEFGTVTKMTVKANEGFVVFCTVPRGLEAVRDAEVKFKATLTPSKDDPKFGFGKRPTLVADEKSSNLSAASSI